MAALLRNYGLSVWWDYGLEAGEEYEPQIRECINAAQVVVVLWCAESVNSTWVIREATIAGSRLLPVRLQNVVPPKPFDIIQSFDLRLWNGAISNPRFQDLVEILSSRLDRRRKIAIDTLEVLEGLPPIEALPIEPLSETGGPEFDILFSTALPLLKRFKPLYEKMKWDQHQPQPSADWFVTRPQLTLTLRN